MLSTRNVNQTEISRLALPANLFVRPGQVRPRINISQNLYNGLNIVWGEKLMKILLSTGIICYLISVQLQTCWILKTKYYF